MVPPGSALSGRITGIENLKTGSGNDWLTGTNGDNVLDGGGGNDALSGNDGNDTIFGQAGTDVIFGDAGNDSLWGGSGTDLIYGGAGTDSLSGGLGGDHFRFYALTDSRAGDGIDTIMDFNPSTEGDRIDLKAIDSNPNAEGIQPWKFIGSDPPTAPSATGNGQATLTWDGTKTVLNLYANDGDLNADFTLNILGMHTYDPANMVGII